MNHPLAEDYKTLSDVELSDKLDSINRKYWMTANEQVRSQMVLIIDELRLEAERRRNLEKDPQEDNKTLDNLIKIS
tara:strand:+ start:4715 stop:4942 length:228 start_codon:yes stop_codon:yes gene_type:complete